MKVRLAKNNERQRLLHPREVGGDRQTDELVNQHSMDPSL